MTGTIPAIGVLVFKDKYAVLLVKHTEEADHITGMYGIPAGRIKSDETEVQAAIRELREETGLKTTQDKLTRLPQVIVDTIKRKDGTTIKCEWVIYLCKDYSGELMESSETIPGWVKVSELGNYKLLPNVKEVINDGLKYL